VSRWLIQEKGVWGKRVGDLRTDHCSSFEAAITEALSRPKRLRKRLEMVEGKLGANNIATKRHTDSRSPCYQKFSTFNYTVPRRSTGEHAGDASSGQDDTQSAA
jgi:hypothetical protein